MNAATDRVEEEEEDWDLLDAGWMAPIDLVSEWSSPQKTLELPQARPGVPVDVKRVPELGLQLQQLKRKPGSRDALKKNLLSTWLPFSGCLVTNLLER